MIKTTKPALFTLILSFLMFTFTANGMKRSLAIVDQNKASQIQEQPQQKKQKLDTTPQELCAPKLQEQPKKKLPAAPIRAILHFDNQRPVPAYLSTADHKKLMWPLNINNKKSTTTDLMASVCVYAEHYVGPEDDRRIEYIEWTEYSLPSAHQDVENFYRKSNAVQGISVISNMQQAMIKKQAQQVKFPRWFPLKELFCFGHGSELNCTVYGKSVILTCQTNGAEQGTFQDQFTLRLDLSKLCPIVTIPHQDKEIVEAGLLIRVPKRTTYNTNENGRVQQTTKFKYQQGPNSIHTPDAHGNTGFEKLMLAPIIKKYPVNSLFSFIEQRKLSGNGFKKTIHPTKTNNNRLDVMEEDKE